MTVSVRVQPGAALAARQPTDDLDLAPLRRLLARAARATLRHEGVTDAEISVTLLDDAEIAGMNAEFLAHDGPTDVISFPLFEADEEPVGDIYIGVDEARRQAAANGVALHEELVRLAVHGVLHVLGYAHPDGAARIDSEMWHAQEAIVAAVMR
jgi:probable rRNA maturation factor